MAERKAPQPPTVDEILARYEHAMGNLRANFTSIRKPTTWIGLRRGSVLRAYMYDFVELVAPHLPTPAQHLETAAGDGVLVGCRGVRK